TLLTPHARLDRVPVAEQYLSEHALPLFETQLGESPRTEHLTCYAGKQLYRMSILFEHAALSFCTQRDESPTSFDIAGFIIGNHLKERIDFYEFLFRGNTCR